MKRRGLSLMELLATMFTLVLVFGTMVAIQISAGKTLTRVESDLNVSQPPALAMRRICDTLRSAVIVTVATNGKTIYFQLPAYTGANDSVTGEKELAYPLVSDGVARSFSVSNGKLVMTPGSRVLAKSIANVDPKPDSTQYNQSYANFQSTSIGSRKAITVTLIAKETVMGKERYSRMKSTVLIQNSK